MKNNIRFTNPIKEALHFQGKRWTVGYLFAIAALALLSVVAFCVNMTIAGTVAAVGATIGIGFFAHWFGIEAVHEEE